MYWIRSPTHSNRSASSCVCEIFEGTLIANGGYDERSGNAAIASGEADLIAFGVPILANPDLPLRYRKRAPLNQPDFATFYAGEEKGYIDYPTLGAVQAPEQNVFS
jgi:N-ethylmaleimide reductase